MISINSARQETSCISIGTLLVSPMDVETTNCYTNLVLSYVLIYLSSSGEHLKI